MPTTDIVSAASSTAGQAVVTTARSGANTMIAKPATVPSAIAIPPIVGVGVECHRSGRGGTTAPIAGAQRRTTAPSPTAAAAAIRKPKASITRTLLLQFRSSGVQEFTSSGFRVQSSRFIVYGSPSASQLNHVPPSSEL